MNRRTLSILSLLLAVSCGLSEAASLGTAFTYQGRLLQSGSPLTGVYDLQFTLMDAVTNGSVVSGPVVSTAVPVTNGLFSATPDFGAVFDGGARWLLVAVRTNGGGDFSPLLPPQPLTAAPYASFAPSAGTAGVATRANSVATGSVTAASLAPGAVSQLSSPGGAVSNAVQVNTNAWVGVGTNASTAALEVSGGSNFLALAVYAEEADGTGAFTNLALASGVAVSGNLAAVAAQNDSAFTLMDTSGSGLSYYSSIRDGQGAFTNLAGAQGVAFGPNNLLAIAAPNASAVTLVSASSPAFPSWQSVLRNGSGWSSLAGACAVAFRTNVLAIAAQAANTVTLVNVATPAAPTLIIVMTNHQFGFDYFGGPNALLFTNNLLIVSAYSSNAVTLVDVSNLSNPNPLAVLNAANGYPYLSTPVALALDGSVLAVASYLNSAVTLVNVANPAAPVSLAVIRTIPTGGFYFNAPAGLAFYHRNGRTMLAVSDANNQGLSVFDVTNPAQPVRRGYYSNGQPVGLHYLTGPRGLGFNANGQLVVAAYGVELLGFNDQQISLVSDGWVGIGTSQPAAALHVVGDVLVQNAGLVELQANQVAMGRNTVASGMDSTAMGYSTIASGNYATSLGYATTASGDFSFAGGNSARALHAGSFVWADSQGYNFDSTAPNQFLVRASGGVGINTASPLATLHVVGSGTNLLQIQNTSDNITGIRLSTLYRSWLIGQDKLPESGLTDVFYIHDQNAGSTRLMIDLSGYVGIGTNIPHSRLEVAGTVTATSFSGNASGLTGLNTALSGNINNAVNFLSAAGVGIGTSAPNDALLDVEGDIRVNNHALWLRDGNDRNHGLAWFGPGTFGSVNPDGPVLFGCSGGSLGTVCGGTNVALSWDQSRSVNIYNTLYISNNLVIDNHDQNTGSLRQAAMTFGNGSGEGIGSKRSNIGGNGFGLDFYTSYQSRLNIDNSGNIGIGGVSGGAKLDIHGSTCLNVNDVYFGQGTDQAHGLGWYGSGKLFAGANVNGPVLYGGSGGALGANTGSATNIALTWDNSRNVAIGNNFSVGGLATIDSQNQNTGSVRMAAIIFGNGSGEGISSKRTSGGNQYGLDFYANYQPRLSIGTAGALWMGTCTNTSSTGTALGFYNTVSAAYATVGGGAHNFASGAGAVVGGGGYDGSSFSGNTASGPASSVVGGTQNTATGNRSTIGGGSANSTTNWYATVPGGAWNVAAGQGSFAAGQAAKALHDGAFVWSDNSSPDVVSTSAGSVTMRAAGGYRLFSNNGMSSGVSLAAGGGSWTSVSDRNAKENFAPVNTQDVLEKVAALPLSTWNYKSQDAAIHHLGPMAQDFKAAFGVGESETGITSVDADGVALAAIQGLNQKLEQTVREKNVELESLKARLAALEKVVSESSRK